MPRVRYSFLSVILASFALPAWSLASRDFCGVPVEAGLRLNMACCRGARIRGWIGKPHGENRVVEQSKYNFEHSNVDMLFRHFNEYEAEAKRLMEAGLPLPGVEMVMKCSHTFNLLDARGAISVTERAAYIGRVRALARLVAQAYYDSREALGFPMCKEAK